MSEVTRIGNFMHRKSGPWSQQVQQFLRYLHNQGFHAVPKPFGFDRDGQEIVSYIEGETFDYPLTEKAKSMNVLLSAARLLRAFHDASINFLQSNLHSQNWLIAQMST